jgi:hypothetical protein
LNEHTVILSSHAWNFKGNTSVGFAAGAILPRDESQGLPRKLITRRLAYFDAAGMSTKDVAKADAWIDAGMGPRYRQQMLRPGPDEVSDTPGPAPDTPEG